MRAQSKSQATVKCASLDIRERQFASLIWRHGQLSRREIQNLTGVHPTLTGNAVATLIRHRLVREAKVGPTAGRGRPQIPLEVDPDRCGFLGLAISPGALRIAVLDATGRSRGDEQVRRFNKSASIVQAASEALEEHLNRSIYSIGVSFTGLMDSNSRQLLFSSAQPAKPAVSLQPIFQAARDRPIVLHNDMHALSMRWRLTNNAPVGNVLMVGMDDGQLGASMLIDGQPQHGVVSAANELGHMRLAVDTDRCYCGQTGCLERIVSTAQLSRLGAKTERTIDQMLDQPGRDRAAVDRLLTHFVNGLANAINFARPEKLVITGPLVRHGSTRDFVRSALPERILPGLRQRVELIFWHLPNMHSAENAAWLVLADVFGTLLDHRGGSDLFPATPKRLFRQRKNVTR